MGNATPDLPPGTRLAFHGEIDSTNAEALRLAACGEPGGLWIWAESQGAGRGRAGRNWTSPRGNLHVSLLLRPDVPLATASQLSLLAGIAVHDAILALAARACVSPSLQLKWPNDVLTDSAKLGGILLESTSSISHREPAVVIGIGLNLAHAPNDLGRPATSIAALGMSVTPAEALTALAAAMAHWLDAWDCGRRFAEIRQAWLDRAQSEGAPISVRQGTNLITGRFLGIDEAGALLLQTEAGVRTRITAGDVSFGAEALGA